MDNLTGQTIKGYELREQVGAGGFGAVYRAYQTSVGREVAVKVILPIHANQPDFVRRFEVEAQLIARLEHPHIVPLYDYWREPDGAFLVMRWLRGSLRDSVGRTPWSSESAARLLDQVAGALTVAHREGVIHRDIKPDNILLDEDDNAYLADFGIAKDLNVRDITEADSLIGSPAYLSPEQIRGETVTERADIYSLGLVIYEALAGEKAFPGATTPAELIYKQLNVSLPPLAVKKPQLPTALDEVLETATAKDPAHRYANVLRFAAAFRAALPAIQRRPAQPLAEPLTERELDILRLMVAGMDNPDIAQKLVLSPATIKWYVKQIYTKLDAHSRHQAIEKAQDLRLLEKPARSTPMMDDSPTIHEIEAPSVRHSQMINPYKGLRAFQESDAADYFGRAALTEHLLARLAESGESARFLAVVGPSGSGKSSAVKAGLIPALRKNGLPDSGRWFISEMLPGTHPLEELEAALLRVAVNPLPGLLDQLREDRRGLVRAVKRVLPSEPEVELALVIDQFEEAFTLVEDEAARNHFLDLLLAAVTDSRSRVRVILTLRADFYDRPLLYPRLAELVRSHTEAIVPLTAAELERAISGPAERVGIVLEDGLVMTMVNEVSQQAGALPLLQYALTELYERRDGQTMTLAAYQAMGGISGALARRADEIYDGLDENGQAAAKQMFLRLVTLGEGVEDTRRRALLAEIRALTSFSAPGISQADAKNRVPTIHNGSVGTAFLPSEHPFAGVVKEDEMGSMDDALDAFSRHRMLTYDRDPLTRGPTVEVAHEALIREWQRLREWLDLSREDIRMQRQLATMSADWVAANQDASLLARGLRLEQIERWAAETGLALTPGEREFVAASVNERERQAAAETVRQAREKALERRSATFLRALVVVLLLATLGAFGLTAAAVNQSQRAESEARIAQTRELVGYAVDNLDSDPQLAALLALQAVKVPYAENGSVTLEAEITLHRAVEALQIPLTIPANEENYPINGPAPVLFSPDGSEIATTVVSFDHPEITKIWDSTSGQLLFTLPGFVMSPYWADQTLITADFAAVHGPTFTRWDVSSRQGGRQMSTTTIPFNVYEPGLSISQNFTLALVPIGAYSIWDLSTGQQRNGPALLNLPTTVGIISPDGTRLLVVTRGQTSRVFDTTTWEELFSLPPTVTYPIRFSRDSKWIISGVSPHSIAVWDASTGAQMYSLPAATDFNSLWVALNADGTRLAQGTALGQITLWDTSSLQKIGSLNAPGWVFQLDFSPDGSRIVAMTTVGQTFVWNISPGNELLTEVNSPRVGILSPISIAYSPDGKRLAASNNNPTPITWDAASGQRLLTLTGHNAPVLDVAWSPDGTRIATASKDNTAILWDANSGQPLFTLTGHTSNVQSVAFSPDSARLVTTSADHSARVWDTATGQPVMALANNVANLWGAAYSPDGARIAIGSDTGVRVWDAASGQLLLTLTGHNGQVNDVAFSPDGRRIASAGNDKTVKIWDAQTGELLRTLTGHTGAVTGVTYSPDGTRIASASRDGTVRLWDVDTGELTLTLNGAPEGVGDVAFSPDGTRLATQNLDGTTRVYVLPIPDLIALAQSRLTRSLTDAECQRYLHVDTCPTSGAAGG